MFDNFFSLFDVSSIFPEMRIKDGNWNKKKAGEVIRLKPKRTVQKWYAKCSQFPTFFPAVPLHARVCERTRVFAGRI